MKNIRSFILTEKLRRLAEEPTSPVQRGGRSASMLKEGMSEPQVFQRYPQLREEFGTGTVADCLLLMVDLSPFSSVVAKLPAGDVAVFLQAYYHLAAGLISSSGGVVEKYIGDAVIAAFGAPFDPPTANSDLVKVVDLSMTLILKVERLFGSELTAKCSIAYGHCHFGYLGPEQHRELTIAGTPLTELFRLEADCPARSIILKESLYNRVRTKFAPTDADYRDAEIAKNLWSVASRSRDLRGVGKAQVTVLTAPERAE